MWEIVIEDVKKEYSIFGCDESGMNLVAYPTSIEAWENPCGANSETGHHSVLLFFICNM